MPLPLSNIGPSHYRGRVSRSTRVGLQITVAGLGLGAVGLLSANAAITFVGFLMLPLLWRMLWRPGEPAVLLFCALFQWAQAFTPVLSADFQGSELSVSYGGPELELAAWASLGSVLVLAVGMNMAGRIFSSLAVNPNAMRAEVIQLNTKKLFAFYFLFLFFSVFITYASGYAGGFRQPLLAFAYIKWVPIVLLAWVTLQERRSPGFLIVVVLIEVVLGFSGYFSTFKTVVFVLLLVSMGVALERGRFRIMPILISVLFILPLVGFWQAVKSDYRNYLNQGTGQQAVLVPYADRMEYLVKAIDNVETKGIADGLVSALERIGYLDYFALTIKNVPSRIPHENGELWMGAMKHTFMPRLLFPGKATLNESERTNKYTFARVAGENEGTAVSLGYPAESYIDFGFAGMFVPVFLLGIFFGWTYLWFSSRGPHFVLGNALGTSLLLFSGHQLEMSNIKIVGGLVTGIIAFAIVQKFAVPWMWRVCKRNF